MQLKLFITLLALFFFFASNLVANESSSTSHVAQKKNVNVWHKTYEDAIKAAKQNKTPILIAVLSSGCSYCEQFVSDIGKNPKLQSALSHNDTLTLLVFEKTDIALLKHGFTASSYPAFFVVSEDGSRMANPLVGYPEPNQFAEYLIKLQIWYKKNLRGNK